jgi:putative membrane protein
MEILAIIFIILTGLFHCLFFKLESLDFMKPKGLKKFGLSQEEGEIAKVWAFNQGFYNLFLALGLFYSAYLLTSDVAANGKMLASFILLTIVGAGVVLFFSTPKKLPAIIQAVPALIGFVLLQCCSTF